MRKGDIVAGTIEEMRFPNKGIFYVKGAQKDSAGNVVGDVEVTVKNALPGQKVSARITKKHAGRAEGMLLSVEEPAPCEQETACPVFGRCGGCLYLCFPEEEELRIKEEQVRKLLADAEKKADDSESTERIVAMPEMTEKKMTIVPAVGGLKEKFVSEKQENEFISTENPAVEKKPVWYEGILESPVTEGYRNKMELTFGDEVKNGPMTLGMHKRGSFYDVTNAADCRIVNADFRRIIRATKEYWSEAGIPFYHRMQQKGYLRHLLIREGMKTGEILVDLVTTTQTDCLEGIDVFRIDKESLDFNPERTEEKSETIKQNKALKKVRNKSDSNREQSLLNGWVQKLGSLPLDGRYAGILHTHNDAIADVVEDQGTDVLYGTDFFDEELLGLRFKVTPFSFFQTNSAGAELLYDTVRKMIGRSVKNMTAGDSIRKPVIFDLYCGTGTISQLVAPIASKVIGVEIVEEAVHAARENAERNHIENCEFICGDVLKVIDTIEDKPDLIILDPPRDGVHPKALPKILHYDVPYILYISCKPTSLARDLPLMEEQGYYPVEGVSVNQFPKTGNVETVVLLCKRNLRGTSSISVDVDMDEYRKIKAGEKDKE